MKTENHPPSPAFAPRPLPLALALAFALSVASDMAAALDISALPLTVGGNVPANVLYIHDDSASMNWAYMPDDRTADGWRAYTSSEYNTIYYDPLIKYTPPPMYDGVTPYPPANFTQAYLDGYEGKGKTVDLSTKFVPIRDTPKGFVWWTPAQPAFYHRFLGGNCSISKSKDLNSKTCFSKIKVGSRSIGKGYDDWDRPEYNHPDNDTPEEQTQNFANWYSYYKIRAFTARAGIGRALAQFDDSIRVGWMRINDTRKITGVRPFTRQVKVEFLKWLYTLPSPGGTPLAAGLNAAGKYYDRSAPDAHYGPWADDPAANSGKGEGTSMAACRKSYAILMTDGMYGDSAHVENADGPASSWFLTPPKEDGSRVEISKAPFGDDRKHTLPDVAWYYWEKDLLPEPNKVGGTTRDPAWWQHMTTYTIGLGVKPESANKQRAFYAADHGTSPLDMFLPVSEAGQPFAWPRSKREIDDLLHAGVNGHGDFFSASNPDEFAESMKKIVTSIADSAGGSGNIGIKEEISGASGKSPAYVFNLTYKTDKWSGDLTAIALTPRGNGSGLGRAVWRASEKMPKPAARHIYTRKNALDALASAGVEFTWTALGTWQQNILKGRHKKEYGQDMLDYLRGSAARENSSGFRTRYRHSTAHSPLGDSPNNTPVYDEDSNTVFLGANDGMLHAFDADTGKERFAYIPTGIFHKLPRLASRDYDHEYYADGDIAIAKTLLADNTHTGDTYLVAALGRGGKGLYGLYLGNLPGSFRASDVKWERNGRINAADCGGDPHMDDMGAIIGDPVIAHDASGHPVVIVGNGYNSCHGKAALYIMDAWDGTVLSKVDVPANAWGDNGLSSPFLLDDGDGRFGNGDTIYAGDLQGNMWRFTQTGSTGWTVTRIFAARNAKGQRQPITASPIAVHHPATQDIYVVFGTGQFLQADDKTDTRVQSWYGLIDKNGRLPVRADLRRRQIVPSARMGRMSDGRRVALRFIDQAVDGDMTGMAGWYIDFDTAPGERIVSPSVVFNMGPDVNARDVALMAPSIMPTANPCGSNSSGWLNIVNLFTGADPGFAMLDTTGDGKVDNNDLVKGHAPAGIGIQGMPGKIPANANIQGMPGNTLPNIDPCTHPTFIMGTASGNVISSQLNQQFCAGLKGRISWREIVE